MQVSLKYYKGIISENVLSDVNKQLSRAEIEFQLIDENGKPMACLEQFVSQIQVLLSPEIVQNIAIGITGSVIYDGIKASCTSISNALKNKYYVKTYAGGKTEEIPATFGIKFNSPGRSFDLQIPSNLENSLKEKCIDEAFNFIKEQSTKDYTEEDCLNGFTGEQYGRYNQLTSKWEVLDMYEEIQKLRERSNNC